MTRLLLVRGMFAGVVAGLLVFALARWIGEPQVEHAIAFETQIDQAKGEAPEAEMFSRRMQRGFGLLTATVVEATAVGGLFALTFAFAYGRLPVVHPRGLSMLLASVGFVTIVVVPALKYPANPPAVGNPETIGARTAAFFLLLACSVAAMAFAMQIGRALQGRLGSWNAWLTAAAFFVAATTTTAHFLPNFEEVPAGFPASLMWKFRIAALQMQFLLWSVLGLFFGWLADREIARQRLRA